MFIGKINGGCWDDSTLILGDMPKDFELSARTVRVLELDEYENLSALCRQLVGACESSSMVFSQWLDICEQKGMGCANLHKGKIVCDAALEAAKKAGITNG